MTTMCIESPEIVAPDLSTESVTTTPMNAGSGPDGGGVELPGSADQLRPQAGARGLSAKPLKLLEAPRPVNELSLAHWALQKVAELPTEPFCLPMTKLPPPGANENPIAVQDAVAVLPPTPWMWGIVVHIPVDALLARHPPAYSPPPLTTTFPH